MSLLKRISFLAVVVLLGSLAATAGTISLTPGPSSGSCPTQSWGCETTGAATFGDGWSVTSGNVDFVNSTWWTWLGSGNTAIDLSGSQLGSIATTLTGLTIGQSYTLTFLYTYNPDDSAGVRSANVSMTNAGGFSYTLVPLVNTTSGGAGPLSQNPGWSTFSQTFTATATTSTLSFSALTNQYQSIVLGSSVTYTQNASAVPEPATLAIVGAGLVLIGLKRYRRA